MKIVRGDLIEIQEEAFKTQNEIKDLLNERLEVTKDIEDEITKIYEKEYDRRKDEIEKYTDERIKLLEKQKKSYEELRKTQQYDKSVKEQTDEIEALQKRIETLKKDSSISGQKKLKELMDELADKQEELEETTQAQGQIHLIQILQVLLDMHLMLIQLILIM